MLPYLLMILGGLMALVGFIGLASIILDPIFTTFTVFYKRKDDYVHFATDTGRKLLKEKKQALLAAYWFLFIVGLLTLGGGAFLKYSSRGDFSYLTQSDKTGEHLVASSDAGEADKDKVFVDDNGTAYPCWIEVKGQDIYYRNAKIEDIKILEKNLQQLDRKNLVYLYDDYAASSIFHEIMDMLELYGLRYETGNN